MTGWNAALDATIEAGLAKCSAAVSPAGPHRWRLPVVNGKTTTVTAGVEEEWVLLEARLSRGAGKAGAWELLTWNARLGGTAKFALGPSDGQLYLRAELPLEDDVPLDVRLRENVNGLIEALEAYHGTVHEERAVGAKADPADIKSLLHEAGWLYTERPGGALVVELETPGAFHQAAVRATGEGGIDVSVEVARCEGYSVTSRRALAVLLLNACGAVRMARASAAGGEKAAARFEVRLGASPCAAEVGHALAALSVACRLCGREARVLECERIAQRYLAIRGCKEEGEQEIGDENHG